jgi:phosphoglycolate phosphatase-like HAD superfamily hydrolase
VKKPSPDPVLEAARRLGKPIDRSLMIGDSPGDIQAGKAAGAVTCGVTFGYRPEEAIRQAGPDFVVSAFPDLVTASRFS